MDDYSLTPPERELIIKALTEAVILQGSFNNVAPTMNIIESIVRKLSTKVIDETPTPDSP